MVNSDYNGYRTTRGTEDYIIGPDWDNYVLGCIFSKLFRLLSLINKVYYLTPHEYSTVDQSFWSKADSDAALLPSWFDW